MTWLKRLGGGTAAFFAITMLVPLVALGALAIAAAAESPLESAADVEPLVATVESGERSREVAVAIAVEYQDAVTPASGTSGTVTSLRVGPGDVVKTGTTVATVNNKRVLAYAASQPLWRDLFRDSKGADVKVAQRLLKSLGHYKGKISGTVDAGTEDAIERFNSKRGFGSNNGVLSIGNLTWIGTEAVTVAATSVAVGDDIAPGTELFTTTSALAAIVVTETPNVPRDAPVVIDMNGIVTDYVPGSGRVTDPDFVVAVAEALGTITEGVANVRLATPVTVGTVPSSAVVSDAQGTSCMFADVSSPPTIVTPLGGSLGTIELDASLVGQPVLVNPREVREDLACS